jgi:hypothetical protein
MHKDRMPTVEDAAQHHPGFAVTTGQSKVEHGNSKAQNQIWVF